MNEVEMVLLKHSSRKADYINLPGFEDLREYDMPASILKVFARIQYSLFLFGETWKTLSEDHKRSNIQQFYEWSDMSAKYQMALREYRKKDIQQDLFTITAGKPLRERMQGRFSSCVALTTTDTGRRSAGVSLSRWHGFKPALLVPVVMGSLLCEGF